MNTPPQRGPRWSRDVSRFVPGVYKSSEVTPNLFEAFFQFALYTDSALQSRVELIIIDRVNLGRHDPGRGCGGWRRNDEAASERALRSRGLSRSMFPLSGDAVSPYRKPTANNVPSVTTTAMLDHARMLQCDPV